jgi:hypothetical protein
MRINKKRFDLVKTVYYFLKIVFDLTCGNPAKEEAIACTR